MDDIYDYDDNLIYCIFDNRYVYYYYDDDIDVWFLYDDII